MRFLWGSISGFPLSVALKQIHLALSERIPRPRRPSRSRNLVVNRWKSAVFGASSVAQCAGLEKHDRALAAVAVAVFRPEVGRAPPDRKSNQRSAISLGVRSMQDANGTEVGIVASDLSDEDLERELAHAHEKRHDIFVNGTADQLINRTHELACEYLRGLRTRSPTRLRNPRTAEPLSDYLRWLAAAARVCAECAAALVVGLPRRSDRPALQAGALDLTLPSRVSLALHLQSWPLVDAEFRRPVMRAVASLRSGRGEGHRPTSIACTDWPAPGRPPSSGQ